MSRTPKPAPAAAKTIGQLIDELADCEAKRTEHSAVGKQLDAAKKDLQEAIFAALDAQGTTIGESPSSHKRVSVSLSEEPTVKDWDVFMAWAIKTKNTHLIQRRVGAPAWREVKTLGKGLKNGEVPGIETFTKRNLSFTTSNR